MAGFFHKIFAKMNGYDAVNERGHGRVSVPAERKNEDGLLPSNKRTQLVATQRDSFRNTTFSPATALQLKINVVGNEGGKLTFTTDDEEFNATAGRAFRRWAKHVDFTDGSSLNETLQVLLTSLTHNGGDFIAVFDDGILTNGRGTGRIRIFESDEIKPVEDAEFYRIYGANTSFTQSNGLVFNQLGQIVGAFVSSRGLERDVFRAGEFIHLKLKTPADFTDSNWILIANRWRKNQGRGVSTLTHVTNLLQDLADTQGSEVMSAKLNAGLGLVVKDTTPEATVSGSRGWDEGGDNEGDGGEDYADDEADEAAENAALKRAATNLQAGQSAIIKLGVGKDIDSFKTERPNLNTVEFIKIQRREAGTVFGMGPSYTTLEPAGSYTAFRGEMIMAYRAFAVLQKKLERDFLDWLAVRFVSWKFFGVAVPEDFDERLSWLWPSMPEVNEGSAQSAIEKKFTNGTITAQMLNGADWRRIADQQAVEKAYYEERGLLYPASRTVSGGVITEGNNEG